MTQEQITMGLGLLRDVIAAGLALAIFFNLNISDEQVAGVLLFVTTVGALVSWLFLIKKTGQAPTTPASGNPPSDI